MNILLSALVIAAVAAFLVWWVRYRAERQAADAQIHSHLTAIRAGLRTAGIYITYDDEPKRPTPHPSADGRHRAKETA